MRLLFLSQLYPPEPATLRQQMARDLVERGHTITAITGYPNYPIGKIYPGYRQRLWQWDEVDGARVLRLPLYPDHSRSKIRRALSYLSFAASAALLGPLLCGKADVMWAYHPPLTVGIPAWWIGLLRRVPFVYEIQDIWPETLVSTGMVQSKVALTCLHAFAKFVYRHAAAIVVSSPGMKRNLAEKGVPPEKVVVIPNWADESIYRPVPADSALAKQFGLQRRFNVVFAGNMGIAQGLKTVVEAAQRLSDCPEVQFVLIGDGVEEELLKTIVKERGIKNVKFIERQPAERMPCFFALADVLLVHLRRDPLFEITIPAKTASYLACGRPILMAVGGDAAEVVRQFKVGITCSQEDPAALANAVCQLYRMEPGERELLGEAGRRAFLESFQRSVLVDQYDRLFSSLGSFQ